MFMGLRRSVGADLKEARERFGVDVWERYSKQLQRFVEQGYLHYDVVKQRLWLTPEGMEVGNQIFAVFVDA